MRQWLKVSLVLGLATAFWIYARQTGELKNNWWQFPTNGEIYIAPVVTQKIVYFANNLGDLHAINRNSGLPKWIKRLPSPNIQNLINVNDLLIASMPNGLLLGISTKTGEEKWQFTTNNQTNLSTYYHMDDKRLYVNDTNGSIYAIDYKNGKLIWQHKSQNWQDGKPFIYDSKINWLGKMERYKNKLYFASPDGYLYAINTKNGQIVWKIFVESQKSPTMQMQQKILYFGKDDGNILAINPTSGEVKASVSTGSQQIVCFRDTSLFKPLTKLPRFNKILHAYKYPLFVATKEGKLISYTLDLNQSDTIMDLQEPLTHCPTVENNIAFTTNEAGSIRSIDLMTKQVRWQRQSNLPLSFAPFLVGNFLLAGTISGDLTSINPATGKNNWQTQASGQIIGSPQVFADKIYFTSTGGQLSNIPIIGGKIQKPKKTEFVQEIVPLGTNEMQEFTFTYDESIVPNPWNQIKPAFTAVHAETNKAITIPGFYYGRDTWKIRFNPPLKGDWKWTATLNFPDGDVITKTGKLTSKTDTAHSYIKINPLYPTKFTLDNKTVFPLIGFQDAVTDTNHNGSKLDDWHLEESSSAARIDLNTYLDAYSDHGKRFNTFRFGLNNASFSIFDRLYVGARPLVHEARIIDDLFSNLRNNSIHVWFSLFSFFLPETTQPIEQKFLHDYIEYIVARYGVYIDIWEIGNEVKATDATANEFSKLIRSFDAEQRPISISWEKPYLESIEITSLHDYESDNYRQADINLLKKINPYLQHHKPIVFSEFGNQKSSWETDSKDRMRIRSWTGLFNDVSAIYWNTTFSRSYFNSQFNNANLYIGDEERRQMAVLNQYFQNIPLNAQRITLPTNKADVRGYGIKKDRGLLGYFVCENSANSLSVSLPDSFIGKVEWFDPESGKILSSSNLTGKSMTTTAPSCKIDLGLAISYE